MAQILVGAVVYIGVGFVLKIDPQKILVRFVADLARKDR
jgi:hypothetical protein